ncbi:MAG: CoA transferase [Candidatus Eisenbacteria bacterium]|uniref:CoA transferase n=1 Tax=Eiseniibacteriota bacterium TaxID=2212470 RepID=A0A948RVJ9_UNCEI|nr:CoA transferase [Candidatus Eisenbacteria bacterium]MBU1947281.1 CoA transferase [Candidatus Eisenbacteria bacterium]MBU2691820.1 CoA transferase [Candidatus Eisenbacteria bacterium]
MNSQDASKSGPPLAGLLVLDLSQILSGPYCTMLLADLGAEVIKIEPPGGDRARDIGPMAGPDSSYFISVNRGKKSVVIDLQTIEGRELFLRMVDHADGLVENFRPGVLDRLGLGHEVLLSRNPRLIYASITGFGHTGPYAQKPAFDIIVQALGGIMSVTGEPGGPPLRPGVSQGDSVAGMFAAIAILAALQHRERTSLGQWIDMSMLDGQVTLMENAFARFFATGDVPGPLGSRHPALTPFQAFPTADGFIVVALLHDNPEIWRRFVELMDCAELSADPRFCDGRYRTENYAALAPMLTEAFKQRSTGEWLIRLSRADISCAPVQNVAEAAEDPQVREREMLKDIPRGDGGKLTVANTPFRFQTARTGPQGPAPGLGEHTDGVLRDLLKLSPAELMKLRTIGVTSVRRKE